MGENCPKSRILIYYLFGYSQGIVYSLLNKKEEAEKQFDMYRSLVPEEFPQKGFLDDVVLEAITSSRQQLEKELQS